MLDANLNRAFEALRTLEDLSRFRDFAHLQSEYKLIRHRLQGTSTGWDYNALLQSRNAEQDVGRTAKTDSELNRTGLNDVANAAAQRLQQSLRCLEEVSKVLYPYSSSVIEAIRYRCYDLNSQIVLSLSRDLQFLNGARLYVLVDCQLPIDMFADRVRQISSAGADLIQIRDKQLDALKLIEYTTAAIQSVDAKMTKVVLNDRADVARISRAWGLHVGQTDLTVAQSRSILPTSSIVGLSTHDLAQVQAAVALGADYIGCGPTFPSSTKSFENFAGLEFLSSVAEWMQENACSTPVFAIGGVTESNLPKLLESGIKRIAVSNAVWRAESPEVATSRLRKLLSTVSN